MLLRGSFLLYVSCPSGWGQGGGRGEAVGSRSSAGGRATGLTLNARPRELGKRSLPKRPDLVFREDDGPTLDTEAVLHVHSGT